MYLNDELSAALLVLLFLTTPLVFALSLYFQDENRSSEIYFPPLRRHDTPLATPKSDDVQSSMKTKPNPKYHSISHLKDYLRFRG